MFAEKYLQSLTTSDLRDDEQHRQTETLVASALADKSARDIGALLHRVKYSGTVIAKITKVAVECERLEKLLVEARRTKADADSKVAGIVSALDSCVGGHTGVGSEVHEFRSLRRAWRDIVSQKGRERKWIKDSDWPTMGSIFPAMVDRIATHSLAYYLDGQCKDCGGTGKAGAENMRTVCKSCDGTTRAKLPPMNNYERKLAEDLISELMALESTHAGIGSAKLRVAA
jgi:hypothetical protein